MSVRYEMRAKFFSLGHDFAVKDARGQHALTIHHKLLSLRSTLTLSEPDGTEIASAVKRIASFAACWDIYRGDDVVATITKRFALFTTKFTLEVGGEPVAITGEITDHEYHFERAGRIVALVSKKWFSVSETYGIEVFEELDPVLAVAAAAVLDLVHHERS